MSRTGVGWQVIGQYEYEYDAHGEYTSWTRCVNGKLADGNWPQWNEKTGEPRPVEEYTDRGEVC